MRDLLRFFFKGEVLRPLSNQPLQRNEAVLTTQILENNEKTVAIELDNIEVTKDGLKRFPEAKLRSRILVIFTRTIVATFVTCLAAIIIFPLLGRETPKIIELLASGAFGCMIGGVGTYLGVNNSTPISE